MAGPGESPKRPMLGPVTEWLRGEGPCNDVVMSSRVRLARNLAGFPFMLKASRPVRERILEACHQQIVRAAIGERMLWINLHQTASQERTLLVERHLISQQLARGKQAGGQGSVEEPRAVAVALPHERIAIMVNEEDHLRMQAIRSGLALGDALADVDRVDDAIEQGVDFAFSARFGYLTACPTNVGTGIRLSVMLHLPALRLTGEIEKVKRAAQDMSLAVRGFYGEGSDAAGDFYQISNQTTLGKAERTLLKEMEGEIVPRVVEYERAARRALLAKRRTYIEDQVYRAYGLLTHARMIATEEAMQALSMVRLGAVGGMLSGVDQRVANQLMLLIQPAHLQTAVEKTLDQDQRRVWRANLIRSRLTPPSTN